MIETPQLRESGGEMDIGKAKERLIEIILEKTFKYSDNPPFTLVSSIRRG
jgi:hypothetical protein